MQTLVGEWGGYLFSVGAVISMIGLYNGQVGVPEVVMPGDYGIDDLV